MGDMSEKFDVGYGKPPKQHQFKKGTSGNPKGRPKGARNKRPKVDPAQQPTDSIILEEAYRSVTIREGDKTIELPAIQAAMRSLAISAMKGSRLSQKALAEIVREVEARRASDHLSALENAIEYKQRWTAELERRKRLGIDEADPVPHPDDIIIDYRTGHIRTEGPISEHEKAHYDECIGRRSEAQEEVSYSAAEFRKAGDSNEKARWLENWHFEQRIFDIINDGLPGRYKAKLEDRSYQPGASKAGKTLEEFRVDRKRPRNKRKWGYLAEGG